MPAFNTRCNNCNAVITRHDVHCYVCGERVPGTGGFLDYLFRRDSPPPAKKDASLNRDSAKKGKCRVDDVPVL